MNQEKSNILPVVICVILLCYFVGSPIIALIMGLSGSDSEKTALAASVEESPERIEELLRLKTFGVPVDIIMMGTSYTSKNSKESLTKPFIFPALEFLVMTEIVQEYKHRHGDKDSDDDDYHSNCGYETVQTNTYSYRDEIKAYLGITDESKSDLNADNLETKAQDAADARCNSDQIRIIQFNAIAEADYLEAIKRCGFEKEKDRDGIFELYKAGYFKDWLEGAATTAGIDYSEYESVIVGYNSVHAAIRGMTAGSVSDFDGESFISPIEANWRSLVSCEFGTGYVGHTGMDLATPMGTRIMAVAAGKVILAQSNPTGYGLYIVIDHGNGYATLYAHNSSLLVSAGDRVEQGDTIALSGNSGNVYPRPTPENPSAGAHLHLEFVVNGVIRNARDFLP